ncbi:hypothetical protein D3C76_1239510 [compost metagenome]
MSFTGQAEHLMMLAAHLLQAIAHHLEEICVGVDHHAIQVKLDHRHRAIDCGAVAGLLARPQLIAVDLPFKARQRLPQSGQLTF